MKRLFLTLIFLVSLLFIPISAKAYEYGIETFNMHVTVLENGDLYIKEAFSMNGTFNGMKRNIQFKNANLDSFSNDKESFEGSDIYNGSAIDLVQIRAIPYTDSISFEEMEQAGTKFTQAIVANKGDFGVYTEQKTENGVSYQIYNPSKKNCFFYLEYIIKDMAILHDDIAEIGWNIFDDTLTESIHHFKADIFIPNNQTLLRGWGHGPLVAELKLDGNNHVQITVDDLYENTAMDTRLVFDKKAVASAKKRTTATALETIIEIETEKADEANELREQYRKQLEEERKKEQIMTVFVSIFGGAWIIGLVVLFYYVYQKHDKEYETALKTEYFRDFPADYNPSVVGYLFHQNISNDDLSACLLNLIYKKVVTFEPIGKKDYKLIYHETELENAVDKQLIKLLFSKNEITLSELKKTAKSGYRSFISKFTMWKNMALSEGKLENFYENKAGIKVKSSLYALLGFFLAIVAFRYVLAFGIILIALAIISLIYFLAFTKKTQKGIEHYVKWNALKRFMEDFGTMDKKDLPEIVLWEKYLVYAVSLGCADKLAKTMELRISEFADTDFIYLNSNVHMMRDMMIFSHVMSSSINTAVNNAYSAQSIANSSNSSGAGFGGGFSGGGGSFGGGSGGGRF